MAKKSRRARRQEKQKQRQFSEKPTVADFPPPVTSVETPIAAPQVVTPTPKAVTPLAEPVKAASPTRRKKVNFAQEYFYVYSELRGFLLITVIMFAVLVGLSFVI